MAQASRLHGLFLPRPDAAEVDCAIVHHGKPAFRRKLMDRHRLRPTGRFETGAALRPAELFELEG